MPNKGSRLKINNRHNTINKELYKEYIKKTNSSLTFKEFKNIINLCNKEIETIVLNDISGFKLPYNLGYFVVNKFRGRYTKPDFKNSLKLNKNVPLLNLHSFGYIYGLKWFKVSQSRINKKVGKINTFKFEFLRVTKRALAVKIKSGSIYDSWKSSDFWTKSKIEKTIN